MRGKAKFVLAAVFLLIAFSIFAYLLSAKPPEFISASGRVSRLEGYAFSTNRVEYRLPRSLLDHKFILSLPNWLRKRIPNRTPEMRNITRPTFSGEPIFSSAFSVRSPKAAESMGGLRIVASDENGNEFDPVVQHAGYSGGNPSYYATEVPAFPRRGQSLILKLKEESEVIGSFTIPNPAVGNYPQWEASDLPVVSEADGLSVALTHFETQNKNKYSAEKFPSTLCGFQVLEGGVVSTNWAPKSGEMRDATGNHWRFFWDPRFARKQDSTQFVGFAGALWEGENAWKLKVDFEKQSGYSEEEIVRFNDLEIPSGRAVHRPNRALEMANARIEIVAILGPEAVHADVEAINPNIWPTRGTITVVINANVLEHEKSLRFLSLSDGNEKEIPLSESFKRPSTAREETYVPYSLKFKPPTQTKRLSLRIAIPRTRSFEFLAKVGHLE